MNKMEGNKVIITERRTHGHSYLNTKGSVRLIMPELTVPTAVRVAATTGDLLFLIGERLVQEDEDMEP